MGPRQIPASDPPANQGTGSVWGADFRPRRSFEGEQNVALEPTARRAVGRNCIAHIATGGEFSKKNGKMVEFLLGVDFGANDLQKWKAKGKAKVKGKVKQGNIAVRRPP